MDDRSYPPRLTPRAVAFGLIAGTLICVASPYNDLAMRNTPLIGNSLPLAATFLILAFVCTINAALHRWRPARAWSSYELALAFTLMMVMGSMPSTGLIRYLLPNLAVPFRAAVEQGSYREIIGSLGLASWVFPTMEGERVGNPIAVGLHDGWTDPSRSPYAAWITPFFAWGVFIAALAWALICLSTIVLRQWRDNEHLTFPLATVQLALLESPGPDRVLNRSLRARGFWIAFACVFLLHANNGLAAYFPKQVPEISRGFDFTRVLTERPWHFCDSSFFKSTVYFSMVGIAFFLSAPVAFSLWAFVVIFQIYKMIIGLQTGDSALPGIGDQRFGVAVAMLFTILWLGRRQWALVAKQAFRGARPGEARGEHLSYRSAFWGAAGGAIVCIGWLVAAGTTVVGAVAIVLSLLAAFVLVTRLVAETGLLHSAMPVSVVKPFELAAVFAHAHVPTDTFYAGSILQGTFYDYRETIPVYVTHGLRDLDALREGPTRADANRRLGRRVIAWIAVALAIAYATSFWSSLWTHYHFAVSLDAQPISPIDDWGTRDNPKFQVLDPTVAYVADTYPATHDRAGNLALGFGVATALTVLRLLFTWWPLHPVGYLLFGLFPSVALWFSIFLGWLAKCVVVRFGTASLYERCKPIFLGLVLGETAAGAAWLVAAYVLHAFGWPYLMYSVLPR